MSADTLHTPLEVLLFLQSLRNHGVDSASFNRTSTILKENEFIRQHNNYDASRLSPDSLQSLYLQLLKDELRSEKNSGSSPIRDGGHSPKRRKLSPPPLRTLDEAVEYRYLIPRLLERLYLEYRDHVVNLIREEEKRYRDLAKEIEDLEKEEKDTQLHAEELERKTSSGVPSIQTLLRNESGHEVNGARIGKEAQESEPVQKKRKLAESITNGVVSRLETTGVPQQGLHEMLGDTQKPEVPPTSHVQSPSYASTPFPPRAEPSHGHLRTTSQSQAPPPILPPLPTSTSPIEHQRPFSVPSVGSPVAASPRAGRGSILNNERGSPIILPPPPGMLASGSPTAATPNFPPSAHGQVPPLPHAPPIPKPRDFTDRPHPYYGSQPPHPSSHSQYGTHTVPPYYPPPQGQIAPYAAPTPSGYRPPAIPSGSPPYQYPGHFSTFQSVPPAQPNQRNVLPSNFPPSQPRMPAAPTTPQTSVADKRRLQGLPPINTSVSSTKWKSSTKNVAREAQRSPGPPDLSPNLSNSPSPSPEPDPVSLDTRVPRISSVDTPSRTSETPTRGRGRGRWGGRGNRGRSGRGGAVSSPASVVRKETTTRSQSVNSNPEETPTDAHPTRRVKAEPPTTPAQPPDDTSHVSTPITDTARSSRRKDAPRPLEVPAPKQGTKRKRAPTLEATPSIPSTPAPPTTRPNQVLASRNFPRVVSALLHDIQAHKLASLFAKPITERDAPGYHSLVYQPQDIKSIRSAISAGNRFVATLPDSAAAAAGEGEPGTPAGAGGVGGGSGTSARATSFWTERVPDVVPPKAIVNSAQLEKEVCRMFANAVMFNPDPQRGFGPGFKFVSGRKRKREDDDDDEEEDSEGEEESADEDEDMEEHFEESGGFVRDAREMFEDVERSVAAWRAAERVSEDAGASSGGAGKMSQGRESSLDELAGPGEDVGAEEGLRRSRRG